MAGAVLPAPPMRAGFARGLAEGLLSVLIAPACASCTTPLDEPTTSVVCRRCWDAIQPLTPPFCPVCGDPLPSWRSPDPQYRCPPCQANRRHIARGRAVGEYEGTFRAILQALKYDGRRSVAGEVSRLMRDHGRAILCGADCAVPVPLHWRRRWRRGFNQAAALAADLGLPVVSALRRVRDTPSQTDLPAERRRANVRDAFRARRGARLRDACVVLVDDVSTTGATLDSCAKALLDAGVREVRTLTAARVVTRRPPSPRR